LIEELRKRDEKAFSFREGTKGGDGNEGINKDSVGERLRVRMTAQCGKKEFLVPYEKIYCYIHDYSNSSLYHSYILDKFPLKADSLAKSWRHLLVSKGFSGKIAVRVSVLDWEERETHVLSGDSLYVASSDSLLSYYIGKRCEVAVTGYAHCSWLQAFTTKDKVLLFLLFLCAILLFFIDNLYRRFKKKTMLVHLEQVPEVTVVEPRSSRVYHFGDELFFDVDASMLYTENKHVELAPMLSKLLQGFLEAEDYKLSIDEIMHLLWPGYDLIDSRVHTTVGRLRKCLSEVSDWQIVNNSSVYQLRKKTCFDK
jgi:hypothetical protein